MGNFPYDAVVFDLDGTLFDAEEGIVSSVRKAMEEMGLAIPQGAELRQVVGPPLRQSFHDLLNVPAGTGLGKIPELLRRAFCEEGYHGFLTLEPHLAMFDFFAPGAKGGKSQKLQFENNPIVEKMKSEMAEPGRPKDGAEAYATQYHALVEILNPILN